MVAYCTSYDIMWFLTGLFLKHGWFLKNTFIEVAISEIWHRHRYNRKVFALHIAYNAHGTDTVDLKERFIIKTKKKKPNKCWFCPNTYLRPVKTNIFLSFFSPICRRKNSGKIGKKEKKLIFQNFRLHVHT